MSAIVGINAGAMAMASKTKGITIASFLARLKMVDVEEKIREKGFPTFSEKEEGDFSDQGFAGIKWKAEIIKVKIPEVDPNKADLNTGLAKLSGTDGTTSESLGITPESGGLSMFTAGLPMVMQQIEQAIREVRVTVYWTEGKAEQSLAVTTHIVNIPGAEVGLGTVQAQGGQQRAQGPEVQVKTQPP
jgi:general secretion pathway protein I